MNVSLASRIAHFFSHLQTLFVLSLESEDLLCWFKVFVDRYYQR
jgi:hypothetical protein